MATKLADQEAQLEVRRDGNGKIFSHVRQKWLVETPEESVRQEYLCVLVNEYGFTLAQLDEEVHVTNPGSGAARADFLIWKSEADRADGNQPLIVVECKAESVQIEASTYYQGANYAQYCHAKFFVTHNSQETKYWRVDHQKMMPNFDEIENIPHADASDKEIDELVSNLRVFKEDEFADVLQRCHDVIRNRESHDPTKAFDETAKILFVKVWVERELKAKKRRKNVFSVEFLDEQIGDDPVNDLFEKTKAFYKKDALFGENERIGLRPETTREIVKLLEKYNLSDTSEDIKGIAFEKFLGRTFRGEIGQFFTPRPIVEFMIRMVDPKEGDIICDPASGSGGFLIRFFEIVRQLISKSIDDEYRAFELGLNKDLPEEERAKILLAKYNELQRQLDQKVPNSRAWKLANRCIYGTDKNDRMARTSKMNMIMHGDGHGGVHHWNGFLNVNGIFEGRFDIILTNPPFGSKVDKADKVLAADIAVSEDAEQHYVDTYGESYAAARKTLTAAVGKPITSLFSLPKASSIKTEVLFVERCLDLLRSGGRLGIVLPEGAFNNPSLRHVREHIEDRAQLEAVVSLPADTFVASGATVKTSLLFVRKFTDDVKKAYDAAAVVAFNDTESAHKQELEALQTVIATRNAKLSDFLAKTDKKSAVAKDAAAKKLSEFNTALKERKKVARSDLKKLKGQILEEARRLLRARARYGVFMYDAEKVGITATGAADDNELFPNARMPAALSVSALEQYQQFKADRSRFLAA